jgi:uncharacterized membrane protein
MALWGSPGVFSAFSFAYDDQWIGVLSIRGELREDPTDLVANMLLHSTRNVIRSRTLAIAFLPVHGAAKVLLVARLVSNKLWSYPANIVVFGAFTVYQLYELGHQYSLFLGAVTVPRHHCHRANL